MKINRLYILLCLSFAVNLLQGQITITKRDETCEGKKDGWIKVSVEGISSQATYAWSRDGQSFAGDDQITGLEPGDYTVTITAPGGCIGTKTARIWPGKNVTVGINAHLVAITPHPIPCGTRPVYHYELTATAQGGTPPYYCSWGEGGGQNGECTKPASGQFIDEVAVIIDDMGCVGSAGFKKIAVRKYCPKDPNDITGPDGFDDAQWISVKDEMDYVIRFENDPIFATSNAAAVFVTVPIDDDVDPLSFRLANLGFGSKVIEMPANVAFYQERIDYSQDLGFLLDVTAGLDLPNNRFFWLLETIDPATGQPPTDPTSGFLPVNDTLTGSGEGFVTFTCKPKTSSLTGEIVEHQASIIFDLNDPILTNTWENTIDAFAPTSMATLLPDTMYSNEISFEWSASDDPGGCGVQSTVVRLSNDNALFTTGALLSEGDSTSITLDWGRKYFYQVRSTDYVNNEENAMVDSFYIVPQRTIEFISPDRYIYCAGDSMQIVAELTTIEEVDLYISVDSGATYILLDSNVMNWPYALFLDSMMLDSHMVIKAVSSEFETEEFSNPFIIKPVPIVNAFGEVSGCDNEVLFVEATGANAYTWSPASIMGTPDASYSNVYSDSSQYVHVHGIDVFGCSATDSLYLNIHPTTLDTLPTPLCEGDSMFINGEWISEEGLYPTMYASIHGCDSTVVSDVYFESPCIWHGGPYVFVDQDATGDNNGTSWADAFNELYDAVYVAGRYENVQEIWVAEGAYKPHATRRDTSFILSDSIRIYGGFLGFEPTREDRTADAGLVKISGDINVPDVLTDNSYHTLRLLSSCDSCIIDGVTITYGRADEPTNGNDIGAGVINLGKGFFTNVVFEHNYATTYGAAVYNHGVLADLILRDCIFRLNTSGLERDILNSGGASLKFEGVNGVEY